MEFLEMLFLEDKVRKQLWTCVGVWFRASQTRKKNREIEKSQGQKAALSRHNTAHQLSSRPLCAASRNLSSFQVLTDQTCSPLNKRGNERKYIL